MTVCSKSPTQFSFAGYRLQIRPKRYQNGRRALNLVTSEGIPFGTLTVNLPDQDLNDNLVAMALWAENAPMRAPMMETGLFEDTGRRVRVGYATAEIWAIKEDAFDND